jgi:hypothetical protein
MMLILLGRDVCRKAYLAFTSHRPIQTRKSHGHELVTGGQVVTLFLVTSKSSS